MSERFEQGLKAFTHSSTAATSEIGEYILSSGGKRLRPMLVLYIARAIGLDEEDVMPIAYTVELLHTASLLHDDVVDETEIRRSKPTANQVFGDKPALLAGDYIFAAAMESTCNLGKMELASNMVTTIKLMTEGELKELECAKKFHCDMDAYIDVIYLKTASLFEFCTGSPAICAGLSKEKIDALTSYGRSIGIAFQIVDDIINVSPVEGDNKDAYNDIDEGKSTLPLIYLFQDQPDILEKISKVSDPEKRRDLVVPHLSGDILVRSRNTAKSYCDDALAALEAQGLLTEDLAMIPQNIMAQIEDRF